MELVTSQINKILIIGNAAGGKTKLAHRLHELYQLPLTHVDSLQFLPGLQFRPHQETLKMLNEVTEQNKWLIDGYGPLDNLEKRFELADAILLIDFPLWRHYWWLFKRQIKNMYSRRAELPAHCNELTWMHTYKIINNIWKVHHQMRPELLKILAREKFKNKVVIIQTISEWNLVFKNGL